MGKTYRRKNNVWDDDYSISDSKPKFIRRKDKQNEIVYNEERTEVSLRNRERKFERKVQSR